MIIKYALRERSENIPTQKKLIVEYRHYSLPLQFPVLLLSGERWRISDLKSERLHFHNCLEIGICHSDSGIMDFKENSIPFKTGDITCVPRHLPHTTYSTIGTGSLWSYIFVDPEELLLNTYNTLLDNLESPVTGLNNFQYIYHKNKYPKINFLANTILDELKQQRPDYQLSVKGLMLSLYIELLRTQTNSNPQEKQVEDTKNILVISSALDHIQKNYMQQITIDDLANLCHLSTSHFRRIFHEIMGAAPLDFLNSTRIEKACRLMRSTDDSILTISGLVGFNSISTFNRCFNKLLNTSPSVWRKQALQLESFSSIESILKFTGWI